MSGPEQAATVTPGQAARAAYGNLLQSLGWETFASDPASVHPDEWEAWEAAAKAVEARTPGSERVAELRTELADAMGRLVTVTRERDKLRDGIDSLALGIDMAASSTAPSKKSEIERGCASALRALLRIDGESGEETRQRLERERSAPAVVTAGTEHLAEKIRGLTIPDEEN